MLIDFTPQEIHILQLKMYNAVSCQPKGYYNINNVILEKLGGEPILTVEEDIYE